MEYRIGDVAELVGLSRDALRFYEKKGIIKASKKSNGYRYYSDKDIYRLMYIVYHRKMNNSLEEIETLMEGDGTIEHVRLVLKSRMEEEWQKLRLHQRAIVRLSLAARDIASMDSGVGLCRLRRFPAGYILGTYRDFQEGLKAWFKFSAGESGLDMTYFYNMFSLSEEGGLGLKGTQLIVYGGVEPYVEPELKEGKCQTTDEAECVYCTVHSETMEPGAGAVEKMRVWAAARGRRDRGIVYSNLMMPLFAGEEVSYCLELYMPVDGGAKNQPCLPD